MEKNALINRKISGLSGLLVLYTILCKYEVESDRALTLNIIDEKGVHELCYCPIDDFFVDFPSFMLFFNNFSTSEISLWKINIVVSGKEFAISGNESRWDYKISCYEKNKLIDQYIERSIDRILRDNIPGYLSNNRIDDVTGLFICHQIINSSLIDVQKVSLRLMDEKGDLKGYILNKSSADMAWPSIIEFWSAFGVRDTSNWSVDIIEQGEVISFIGSASSNEITIKSNKYFDISHIIEDIRDWLEV